MLKDTIKKIEKRVRYRLVLSLMFEKLATIGIKIKPFYLTQNVLFDEINLNLESKFKPLEVDFLSSPEINKIYDHPESKQLALNNKNLEEEGYMCFGLRSGSEVVSYLWCNLHRCHELHPFLLKEDEAYMTGVYTFQAHRGKKLALFMRYELYKYLNRMGRNKFYDFINMFNTPAIKMERKLKAKPIKIFIFMEIFNKYHWNIMIRSPKKFLLSI
jgi:hypothetical protein